MSASGWQVFVEVPGKAPIELAMGESVIGRSRSAPVQIAESTVSRQHAILVVEPGVVRLKDLGSSNGTFVNGKRVEGTTGLSDGDKIVVGEAELVIRILAPLGPAEATQRLVLPPMTSPLVESGAKTAPAPEPVGFRPTPTPIPEPFGSPAAAASAAVPDPPRPMAPPAAPAWTPEPPKPAIEPRKGGEVLGSIREIDSVPVPPVPVRKPVTVDHGTAAGFWVRVAAALLDSIPVLLLAGISVALSFFVSSTLGMLVSLLQFAYGALIAVVMPALKGETPGKKLLKLRIVTDPPGPGPGLGWGPALIRLAGHLVCSLTFGLGYLLVAFTAQKQGLHDLIAKTRVVRRA